MTVSNNLKIDLDDGGNPTYGIDFCDVGFHSFLAASTEETVVVPPGRHLAIFSFGVGTDVFVLEDDGSGAAILPGAGFTATTQDLNPIARNVTPGQTLHFISRTNSDVKVSFYVR